MKGSPSKIENLIREVLIRAGGSEISSKNISWGTHIRDLRVENQTFQIAVHSSQAAIGKKLVGLRFSSSAKYLTLPRTGFTEAGGVRSLSSCVSNENLEVF